MMFLKYSYRLGKVAGVILRVDLVGVAPDDGFWVLYLKWNFGHGFVEGSQTVSAKSFKVEVPHHPPWLVRNQNDQHEIPHAMVCWTSKSYRLYIDFDDCLSPIVPLLSPPWLHVVDHFDNHEHRFDKQVHSITSGSLGTDNKGIAATAQVLGGTPFSRDVFLWVVGLRVRVGLL